MEWQAPGIVLNATAYGEGDALATIFTEAHGVFRGLARGGLSRAKANIWQAGNLVEARWVARLSDQLGSYSAELVHPAAALAMDDPMTLAILAAACAVAEGALPERNPQPRIFRGLLHLIAHLRPGETSICEFVAWELGVLGDLGYGLDLERCAVTGAETDIAFVSPKTGRAVCTSAAGLWRERLLKLPAFFCEGPTADPAEWLDGLKLTGHFLARDAFGAQHRPVPAARQRLYDQVSNLAGHSLAAASET